MMKTLSLIFLTIFFFSACDAPRTRSPYDQGSAIQSADNSQFQNNDNNVIGSGAGENPGETIQEDTGFEHCSYSLSNAALEIGNVSVCLHRPTRTKFRVKFDISDPIQNTCLVPMYQDPATLQSFYLSITIPCTSQTLEIQQDQFYINRPGLPNMFAITHVMVIKDLIGAYAHFFDCMNATDPFLKQQICSAFENIHFNRYTLVPVEF